MKPERWDRLNELFHTALALARAERALFLERACGDDGELRSDVDRLITAHERAGAFIESPALASAGPFSGFAGNARSPGLADTLSAGQRVGPYRIAREIARGGMGTVYLAERADGHYEQQVALKVVKRGMDTDLILERFRAERQILASLQHPNIARLLDGGTADDGRPYFVMEHIEGEPIDGYVRTRDLKVRERLRLFLHVCDAVAYAHARRIVHRDIKPLNILVTADGTPKLLDFGIARVLEQGEALATAVTGWRVLTPEYASPEQVEGRRATEASDIYSLGVVLYELLTGCSPYRAQSGDPIALAAAVCMTNPERPSARIAGTGHGVRQELRGDLDTIVLVALRKEPERRYESVARMADDIRRHLDGLPVLARPDRAAYRAGKFLRRNRAAVLAATAAGLTFAGLTAAASVALLRGTDEPTLIASGALAPRDRILVGDFADGAGDPALAAALTDALRVDLAQSSVIDVPSAARIRAALERMELAPDLVLDDTLTRDVALREGARAFVSGSIAKVGGAYTINLRLIGTERGEVLGAVRETARDSTGLLATLDRASKAIRRRIGESIDDIQSLPPLEQVTTASVPALRVYTEGYRLFLNGERTRALPLLERAVALDTGFAAAHRAMAIIYEALAEPGRSRAALAHALANRDRLPFLDRQFMIASNAYANGDHRAAIEEYERVLARFPAMVPALNNQALAYRDMRQPAKAEALWHRAIAADSTIPVLYYGLHSTQVLQGRFNDSRNTLDLVARRFPSDPVLAIVRVQDAAARQAWKEAEQRAEANAAARIADTLALVDAYEVLAGLAATQGRLADAVTHWTNHRAVSAAAGSDGRYASGVVQLGYLELRFGEGPRAAAALVDSLLALRPLEAMLPGDRPYHELARFFAAAAEPARARDLLAAADRNDRELGRLQAAQASWTRGVIAAADGRLQEAETELRQAADTHVCPICPLPDLARVLEAAARPEAAADAWQSYIATPWLWRYQSDAHELGPALERLAGFHEQRGETDQATAAYAGLLALWHDADPVLHARLDGPRSRLLQIREVPPRPASIPPNR